MTAQPAPLARRRRPAAPLIAGAALAVLLGAIAVDTTVVPIGENAGPAGFSIETYGPAEFPAIQADVAARAVDAATLAAAIAADREAAAAEHGVASGGQTVFPVRFTGVAGEGRLGVYPVTVEGLPEDVGIRVQTGPAINGTDLRDATGTIAFGQFTNQIEYQNAGASLNNAMKAMVLEPVDTSALQGRTVEVVGVFRLVNPRNWLVTPVEFAAP